MGNTIQQEITDLHQKIGTDWGGRAAKKYAMGVVALVGTVAVGFWLPPGMVAPLLLGCKHGMKFVGKIYGLTLAATAAAAAVIVTPFAIVSARSDVSREQQEALKVKIRTWIEAQGSQGLLDQFSEDQEILAAIIEVQVDVEAQSTAADEALRRPLRRQITGDDRTVREVAIAMAANDQERIAEIERLFPEAWDRDGIPADEANKALGESVAFPSGTFVSGQKLYLAMILSRGLKKDEASALLDKRAVLDSVITSLEVKN